MTVEFEAPAIGTRTCMPPDPGTLQRNSYRSSSAGRAKHHRTTPFRSAWLAHSVRKRDQQESYLTTRGEAEREK